MRTISAGLTTAQQAAISTPAVHLLFTDNYTGIQYEYKTTDATMRIITVRATEGPFVSLGQIQLPNDKPIPISAIVRFSNHDNLAVNYKGFRLDIGWGYVVSGTPQYSYGEPYFVVRQKEILEDGLAFLEFECISAWTLLMLKIPAGNLTGPPYSMSGTTVRSVLTSVLTDPATQVWTYIAAAYADKTAAADDDTADDITVVALTAGVGDMLYIGSDNPDFDRITIDISQVLTATGFTFVVEFSAAAASWTAVSNLQDSTQSFAKSGPGVISFDYPGSSAWVAQSVNGVSKYYIRIRITGVTTVTQAALARRIGLGHHFGLNLSSSDGLENSLTPSIKWQFDDSIWLLVFGALELVHSRLIMKQYYIDMGDYTDSPVAADYTYDIASTHPFISAVREIQPILPNRITVVDEMPDAHRYTGSDEDTASQRQFGNTDFLVKAPHVVSNADAANVADRMLKEYAQEVSQGEVIAPMNVAQEPWDWIEINDTGLTLNWSGRVASIIRLYDLEQGQYLIQLKMGF